ncbi:hypothetical protein [Deinococcus radiophilus]|uniref:hypothetical protein n=1 Tax=Deinococcus radiophilus TaxID=32062 RepID=UPI003610C695
MLLTNQGTQSADYRLTEQGAGGLEMLDGGTFEGTLAPGETKELSYRVRAPQQVGAQPTQISGELNSGACAVLQTSVAPVRVVATPPPAISRSSEVFLPFTAPVQAQTLIVSHRVPAGASYLPGSARLGTEVLPDPLVGPSGLLYWEIPAQEQGQLSYSLQHTAALPALDRASLVARYGADRQEILEGDFDARDLTQARPFRGEETLQENDGALKLPLDGAVFRNRDKISVVVEVPQGSAQPLTVNGEVVSAQSIGTNVQDSVRGVQRLTYVGVPLRPGPNVLQVGSDRTTVTLAAPTQRIVLEPLQLVADGSTPVRVRVTALDQFGTPTAQPSLTLNPSLEPYAADASPTAGYQVRLTDGVGVLELRPQTVPGELTVEADVAGRTETFRFQIVPDGRRFGVGVATATVGLDGNFGPQQDLTWTARGYYEGPLADGKLFVAGDKDGLPHDQDPFERFAVSGDASVHSVPLQGIDPVAAVYDHPGFRAAYRREAPPLTVLPLNETLTAATVQTRTNPSVSGFAAYLPADRIELRGDQALVPDGLRVVHLPHTGISRGSDSLELVVRERGTGKELRRERLIPFGDYSIDYSAGVVTLNRELQAVDTDFNDVRIEAVYRLDDPLQNREWAYGAQVVAQGEHWTAGVAAVQMPEAQGNGQQVTVGARAQYDNREGLQADARVAYADGVQASLDAGARLRERGTLNDEATLRVRYQDHSYDGLGRFNPGFSVAGRYHSDLSAQISAQADAEYRNNLAGRSQGRSVVW